MKLYPASKHANKQIPAFQNINMKKQYTKPAVEVPVVIILLPPQNTEQGVSNISNNTPTRAV